MFSIDGESHLASKSRAFGEALQRLPEAHTRAQAVGVGHIHGRVVGALEQAGMDHGPVHVIWDRGHPFIGVAHGEAGDQVADAEFGTPEHTPTPIIRTTARSAAEEANHLYGQELWGLLGW